MGWPDAAAQQAAGLDYFYPTSTLVTGPDIIFFWVARMIMAGLEFMGDNPKPETRNSKLSEQEIAARIPFRNVYFTGIIRDQQGRKMSKSLGNSPDPLTLIDKYGADGLRFGIISIAPQGQDIRFQEDRIEGGKNFCNKLWNASRFRQMSGPAGDNSSLAAILARLTPAQFDADDHAILQRLVATTAEIERCLREFEFSAAVQTLYSFFWGDFCDWYVEVSKAKLQNEATKLNCLALQDLILRQTLLLLHPFTPFITEELWENLGYLGETPNSKPQTPNSESGTRNQRFLMRDVRLESAESFAAALAAHGLAPDRVAAESVEKLKALVSQCRALKAEHNLASRRDVRLFLKATEADWTIVSAALAKLTRLCGAKEITRRDNIENLPATVTPLGTLYLDITVSVDSSAETVRLTKELEKIAQHIAGTEARLNNPTFVGKAPPAVIDGAKKQLADLKAKQTELQRLLVALG